MENIPIPKSEDPHPHEVRVGWSSENSSLQLGEDSHSFGFGSRTGDGSYNNKFSNYSCPYGEGWCFIVIVALLEMSYFKRFLTF